MHSQTMFSEKILFTALRPSPVMKVHSKQLKGKRALIMSHLLLLVSKIDLILLRGDTTLYFLLKQKHLVTLRLNHVTLTPKRYVKLRHVYYTHSEAA